MMNTVRDPFFTDSGLRLQKTREEDLNFVLAAERAPENAPFVYQDTKEEHRETVGDANILHLTAFDEEANRVGYMILCGLKSDMNSRELRRLVVVEKGRGYGTAMLRAAMAWCFEVEKGHRLFLDVAVDNAPALRLYEKSGFVREGILRQAMLYNGQYKDMIMMSILEDEYRVL